jgi:hypothetical protein
MRRSTEATSMAYRRPRADVRVCADGGVPGSADVYRGPEGWKEFVEWLGSEFASYRVVRGQGFTRSDDALEAAGLSE